MFSFGHCPPPPFSERKNFLQEGFPNPQYNCIKKCITSLVAGQSVWTPDGSGIITVARWVLGKYKSFQRNTGLGCNVQWIQAGSANTTRARNVLTQKANLPWLMSLLAVWKLWHLLVPMSQGDSQRFLQIIHDFSRAHIHMYLYFGPFLLYFPRHRSPHYNNDYWSKSQ